jgi:hypothetical protein
LNFRGQFLLYSLVWRRSLTKQCFQRRKVSLDGPFGPRILSTSKKRKKRKKSEKSEKSNKSKKKKKKNKNKN